MRIPELTTERAIAIGALIVLGVLLLDARCSDIPRTLAQVEAAKAEASRDSASAERWRAIGRRAEAQTRVARAEADRAHARADSLDSLTPAVIVRWDTLPDTASVATVRATADSVIAHLTDVGARWREAYLARTDELRATRLQLTATENERDAQERRAEALSRAVTALEAQLEGSNPWLPTTALVGAGAGLGYAAGGLRGALTGAGIGGGVAIVWFGLDDFIARPW